MNHMSSGASAGGLERDSLKDSNVQGLAKEVDRAMKDLEDRVYRVLNDKVDQEAIALDNKMETNFNNLSKKLREMKSPARSSHNSLQRERQKVVDSTSTADKGGMKKIESALNDWLEKVEEQVNLIEDKVAEKASSHDIQQLEMKI